jgi:hypothetical protein
MATPREDEDDEQQGKKKKASYRLHRIRVNELSFVDRGANRCRFLIVKRSNEMDPNAQKEIEVSANEDGELVTETPTKKEGEVAAAPAPAPTDGAPPPAADPAEPKEAALKMPGAVKEKVLRTLTATIQGLVAIGKEVKDAEETDEKLPSPIPSSVSSKIKQAQDMLGGVLQAYPNPSSAGGDTEKLDEDGETAPAEKTGDSDQDDDGDVEKRRSTMSAKAFKDAQKALTILSGFFDQAMKTVQEAGLVDALSKKGDEASKEPDEKPDEKSVEKQDASNSETPAESQEPRPQVVELPKEFLEHLQDLGKGLTRVATVAKSQGDALQRQGEAIEALRRSPRSPQSISVEGPAPTELTVWPIDLNGGETADRPS